MSGKLTAAGGDVDSSVPLANTHGQPMIPKNRLKTTGRLEASRSAYVSSRRIERDKVDLRRILRTNRANACSVESFLPSISVHSKKILRPTLAA